MENSKEAGLGKPWAMLWGRLRPKWVCRDLNLLLRFLLRYSRMRCSMLRDVSEKRKLDLARRLVVWAGRSWVVIILRNRFIKVNFDHNQLAINHSASVVMWIIRLLPPVMRCFEPFFAAQIDETRNILLPSIFKQILNSRASIPPLSAPPSFLPLIVTLWWGVI